MQLQHYFQTIGRYLKDSFVPHERNNHRPHALQHRALVLYSVMLVFLKVLIIIVPLALPSVSLFSSAITSDNIIGLTNQARQNLNLSSLKLADKLSAAAQAKADDMVVNQYFAHTSPGGTTPWQWIQQAGYKYSYAGENLAVNFTSSEGVQEGWMASASHRANIVNPHYTEIGVGVATGQFEGYTSTFVVEMFGRPLLATTPTASVPAQPVVEHKLSVTSPKPTAQVAAAEVKTILPAGSADVKTANTSTNGVNNGVASNIALPPTVPVIDDSSLFVQPHGTEYHVRIAVTGAQTVTATLVDVTSPLQLNPDAKNMWEGNIAYRADQFSRGGELITITAVNKAGQASHPLALIAPKISTQQLYVFNDAPEKTATFFGFFTVHHLDDAVTRFYLYFVVGLVAALLINIFVKIKVQQVSLIGHTVAVIGLALLLIIV